MHALISGLLYESGNHWYCLFYVNCRITLERLYLEKIMVVTSYFIIRLLLLLLLGVRPILCVEEYCCSYPKGGMSLYIILSHSIWTLTHIFPKMLPSPNSPCHTFIVLLFITFQFSHTSLFGKIWRMCFFFQPDCHDVPSYGYTEDGPYEVKPTGAAEPFFIYCEFDVDGTAWTLIQRRVNGFTSFNRTWQEYQQGFGVPGPASNYW